MRKNTSRNEQRFITTAAVATVSMLLASQQAHAQAALRISAFAPTGANIAQADFSSPTTVSYGANDPNYVGYEDFVDNGSQTPPGGPGQIFTPTTNFNLNTLTVKGGGGSGDISTFAGNVWTISLGTVPNIATGAAITVLRSETVDVSHVDDAGNKAYVSLTLSSPLALTAGTNYVWMIHRTTGNSYYSLAKSAGTTDLLPNGASFTGDLSPTSVLQTDFVHNGPDTGGFQDRTFFLNGTLGAAVVQFSTVSTNWVHNGNGSWEAAANWASNPLIPGALGSNVTFDTNGGAITSLNPVVTLSQAATLTTMTFDRPGGGYTINNGATGVITLTAEIDVLSGNHTINVPVTASTPSIITAVAGSSLTIPSFTPTGYGSVALYGGGSITLGGIGNCTLHTESPDMGTTPGVAFKISDNSNPGFLYAIITDATSSVNIGVNSVNSSGIYGAGTVTIPAGGTLYNALYGNNDTNTTLAGAGSMIIGNNPGQNDSTAHVVNLTGVNSSFNGTITVGTNNGGQMMLTAGTSTALGSGNATNKVILDGGVFQATAGFATTTGVSVTALASLPAGSTVTDSKIDTAGFDVGLGPVTSAGPLTKISAGKLSVGSIRGGTLAINAGSVGIATSASRAAGVSVLNALTLAGSTGAWTTTLDLANNDLVVHNGNVAQIRDQLKQGYHLGGQNGSGGILSSTAAASTLPKTTLGYGTLVGTVDGQTTTATDVVIRYTVAGDATLDLAVGFSDLVPLAQNYNLTNRSWSQGDFNYDGAVNFGDLVILAQNYNSALSVEQVGVVGSAFAADFALAQSLVPEPTTLGLLGGLATVVVRRRRANA